MHRFLTLLLTLVLLSPVAQSAPQWEGLLSTGAIRADAFLRAHPQADGSGVVVAVLDTGVDPTIPGLQRTPDGAKKVIWVRDFSGQGDLALREPELDASVQPPLLRQNRDRLSGFEAHGIQPDNDAQRVRMTAIAESDFANSDVTDLNDNGRYDDRYGVVVYTPSGTDQRVAIVDTDADFDLADETPVQSYEIAQETFYLAGADPKKQLRPLAFALYLDPDSDTAEVHFDDGGHGSHVAGISTGYELEGKAGYHGIAPGAKVMSLKIGNNALAGGATTSGSKRKALEYAAEWAEEHDTPVVVNLSYGIGSEIEGDSDIDDLVTSLLQKHPTRFFVSTSCGNSGPGLSTAGQPSASALAFTAGAALTPENAADLYAQRLSRTEVFSFSSRGGELIKPDALLPGVAASTVPAFFSGSVMAGTSMAAPQGAGAHALLVSFAQSKGLTVNNGMVRRALTYTARPLKGYTPLDQGHGLVDVVAAADALPSLARSEEARGYVGYHVSTESPLSPDGETPAAYWRTGAWLPPSDWVHRFEIRPIFAGELTPEEKDAMFASFRLESLSSWIDLDSPRISLRGNNKSVASLRIRRSKLNKPGLYVGKVRAVAADGPTGRAGTAFELMVTAIVPEVFPQAGAPELAFQGRKSRPGQVDRYFVLVPAQATSVRMNAKITAGDGALRVYAHGPRGRRWRLSPSDAKTSGTGKIDTRISTPALEPGVWEFDVISKTSNRSALSYDLDLTAYALVATELEAYTVPQGDAPEALVQVTNRSVEPFIGKASGEIDGYQREFYEEATGDTVDYVFQMGDGVESAQFDLWLDPETYVRFTDVAVTVLDSSGDAVAKGGFGQAFTRIRVNRRGSGTYRLQIRGALTFESEEGFSVRIRERYRTRDRVGLSVTGIDGSELRLYPHVTEDLNVRLSTRPRTPPDGYELSGQLRFNATDGSGTWLNLPVSLTP